MDPNGTTVRPWIVGDLGFAALALVMLERTTILVDGAVPAGAVGLNITAVSPIDMPVPLGEGLYPAVFATVQPAEASFSPAAGIFLPRPFGFPFGTMADVWFFDDDVGAWVNRSEETGNQTTSDYDFFWAEGVVAESGWYAVALPVEADCPTTLEGRVVELDPPTPSDGGSSKPIADVLISLSTGQVTRTGPDGRFRVASVSAYGKSFDNPCTARELQLRALVPVALGAEQVIVGIGPQLIVLGGTTEIPDILIRVADTGSLVGVVTDEGAPVEGELSMLGASEATVRSDALGSFFLTALAPGQYTATFPFERGDVSANFEASSALGSAAALGAAKRSA